MHKQHEIYMKYTCNIHGQRQKTQRHLYSTDWRWGLASGLTQILSFSLGLTQILALGNAKITNMLVSPSQNSGVGGIAQCHPPTPGILRRSGI